MPKLRAYDQLCLPVARMTSRNLSLVGSSFISAGLVLTPPMMKPNAPPSAKPVKGDAGEPEIQRASGRDHVRDRRKRAEDQEKERRTGKEWRVRAGGRGRKTDRRGCMGIRTDRRPCSTGELLPLPFERMPNEAQG